MAIDTMQSALGMAFHTALLLTGTIKTAEAAVIHGIGTCEDLSPRSLLIEAARCAVRRRTKSADTPFEIECLSPELRYLFMLQPLLRHCFVLRILVGLSPEVSAEFLDISITEVEGALHEALTEFLLLSSANN